MGLLNRYNLQFSMVNATLDIVIFIEDYNIIISLDCTIILNLNCCFTEKRRKTNL